MLLNEQVVRAEELSRQDVADRVAVALEQARADAERYRGDRPPPAVTGATVVVVDDGAATGATVRAALAAVRAAGAARVVVGLPVAPRETLAVLEREADAVVCLRTTAAVPRRRLGVRATSPRPAPNAVVELLGRSG